MTIVTDYRALLSGSYWFPIPSDGSPLVATPEPEVLTYSFAHTASATIQASSPATAATFQQFSASDQAATRLALQQWSQVSGITFIETTASEGDLTFAYYNLTTMGYAGTAGLGNYPSAGAYITSAGYPETFGNQVAYAGDVYVDTSYAGNPSLQTDLAHVLVHEIGHTLGLKHPFDAGAYTLDPSLDNGDNTVMSYTGARNATLGPLDVAAAQAIYGDFGAVPTSWTWSWNAAAEIYTVHSVGDDQFVRGVGAVSDIVYAPGLHDAVVTAQGNDVIYADGQPLSINAGAGNDTVYTGLTYADLVGGVGGSGDFRYVYLAGDYQEYNSVETLVFTDGTYSTATNNFTALQPLSVEANDAALSEGNGPFVFQVIRTDSTAASRVVNWNVLGSGAAPANAADFAGGVLPSGQVTFAAGQAQQSVTVALYNDTLVEPDEQFTLQLSDPASGLALGSATGTIVDDDLRVDIAATSLVRAEGNSGSTPFVFTVSQIGRVIAPSTVVWAVQGSGASPVNGADFVGGVLPSGTLSFAIGDVAKQVTLAVAGDTQLEPDEGFVVVLSGLTGLGQLGVSQVGGEILNDDAPPLPVASISPRAPGIAEGNSGTSDLTFTVSLSAASASVVTVAYGTANGTATAGSDYVATSGTLTFAAGQTSQTFQVPIIGDTVYESDETFFAALSAPAGAVLATDGSAAAIATITNDDAPATNLVIAATSASKSEGNAGGTPFTFTVSRTGGLAGASSVGWSVSGLAPNSANPADFAGGVVPAGTVSFAAGVSSQTITVLVQGDTVAEADEHFQVVLSHPLGATIVTGSASATIINDDTNLAISSTTGSHAEGNSGSTPFVFTVTRTGDISGANSVAWYTVGALPASVGPNDFVGGVAPSGTLSFAAGVVSQTVTVNVAGDTLLEPDEYFQVGLRQPTGGATITTALALAKVVNDDTGFTIAATDAVKPEGNSGSTAFTFTVTRSGNVAGTHSIAWIASGLAPNSVGPADFVAGSALSGGLIFSPGQTTQTITLQVRGDTAVEPDEHFTVLLRNASAGAAILVNHADGTILNDDGGAGGDAGGSLAQVAAADFNGDGTADLLRQAVDGDLYVLDGASGVQTAVSQSAAGLAFVAAADFTGDGRSDLLLRSGQGLYDWTMAGATVARTDLVTVLGAGATVAAVRDFTGDGRADILLNDGPAGGYTLLAMNGGMIAGTTSLATLPDAWHVPA